MKAIEKVTADKANHTPDLGGKATTRSVTDAVKKAIRGSRTCGGGAQRSVPAA